MSINSHTGTVDVLNLHGLDIIQIFKGENFDSSIFYVVSSFEPPTLGGIQTTPYVQISGHDVTEIFKNNVNQNALNSLNQIKTLMDRSKKKEYQYSHDFSWIYYKSS